MGGVCDTDVVCVWSALVSVYNFREIVIFERMFCRRASAAAEHPQKMEQFHSQEGGSHLI